MTRAPLALLVTALAGCITSNGAPGQLCFEPTDCDVVHCDCDGDMRSAESCLPSLVCGTKAEACAIACASDAGP